MKFVTYKGLIALLTLCCSLLYAADSRPPKLRLSEVEAIQPLNYRADLTLDPTKDVFQGSISIHMDVKRPLKTIWLNQERISIKDATISVNGKVAALTAGSGISNFVGLQSATEIPAGDAELKIDYTGTVVTKSSSAVFRQQDKGNWYIFSQFEAIDARGAFPCFDEPSYKTPWQLTLHIPSTDTAISNTKPASDETEGATRTVVFGKTKPLPSYLVAFAVGPFEYVPAGFTALMHAPVRIVVPKGHADEAKYAAEVTAGIINHHEAYFGIPFPYDKADQVAVPDTSGWGAMENPGMVTYQQNLILSDPKTDTIQRKRIYFEVAAHELAHQWFGDLVTTTWWNDIWLNEAFATWFERKTTGEMHPEWGTTVEDVNATSHVMEEDSLVSARQIRQPIESINDINNAFDGITYQKGAAVIGMFENWITPATFQLGVHNYLTKYAWRATTADDFLGSLSATAKKDVASPFLTFLNQSGIPMITMDLKCSGNNAVLHLEQQRYLPVGSQGAKEQLWRVPFCIRDSNGDRQCTLLAQKSTDWHLKASSCPTWIDANADAKGYYRVAYQGQLQSQLISGDMERRLSPGERLDLLGDTKAAAVAGKLPYAAALTLTAALHNDPQRNVLLAAADVAASVNMNLVPDTLRSNFQRFLLANFGERARNLGWASKPGESDDAHLLRAKLVPMIATVGGDQELAKQARSLADGWLQDHSRVQPDMTAAVLSTAAYYGDKALFDRFLAAFVQTGDRQTKHFLAQAMSSFRDPAAIRAGVEALVEKKVPFMQGQGLLFGGAQFPATRKLPFELLKTHYDQITAVMPSEGGIGDFGGVLPSVGQALCDSKSRDELSAFFQPRLQSLIGAPRTLKQVLENINLCIALTDAQKQSVATFLAKY